MTVVSVRSGVLHGDERSVPGVVPGATLATKVIKETNIIPLTTHLFCATPWPHRRDEISRSAGVPSSWAGSSGSTGGLTPGGSRFSTGWPSLGRGGARD